MAVLHILTILYGKDQAPSYMNFIVESCLYSLSPGALSERACGELLIIITSCPNLAPPFLKCIIALARCVYADIGFPAHR